MGKRGAGGIYPGTGRLWYNLRVDCKMSYQVREGETNEDKSATFQLEALPARTGG
jgi:hypothetical protein